MGKSRFLRMPLPCLIKCTYLSDAVKATTKLRFAHLLTCHVQKCKLQEHLACLLRFLLRCKHNDNASMLHLSWPDMPQNVNRKALILFVKLCFTRVLFYACSNASTITSTTTTNTTATTTTIDAHAKRLNAFHKPNWGRRCNAAGVFDPPPLAGGNAQRDRIPNTRGVPIQRRENSYACPMCVAHTRRDT